MADASAPKSGMSIPFFATLLLVAVGIYFGGKTLVSYQARVELEKEMSDRTKPNDEAYFKKHYGDEVIEKREGSKRPEAAGVGGEAAQPVKPDTKKEASASEAKPEEGKTTEVKPEEAKPEGAAAEKAPETPKTDAPAAGDKPAEPPKN